MIDYNCYLGYWPFYKLSANFEDLKKAHEKNNIEYGYVSSLQSIFYNDSYESEKDLYNEIKGSNYKQVTIINPTLPSAPVILKRCVDEFKIAGVKLMPGYHKYTLSNKLLKPILDIVKEYNLYLFITLRVHHNLFFDYIVPDEIDCDTINGILKENPEIRLVVNYANIPAMRIFKEEMSKNPNAAADISAFTGNLFETDEEITKNLVFGSSYPLSSVGTLKILADKYSNIFTPKEI